MRTSRIIGALCAVLFTLALAFLPNVPAAADESTQGTDTMVVTGERGAGDAKAFAGESECGEEHDGGQVVGEFPVEGDLALNYVYVESPFLVAPGVQNIVVSLGEGTEQLEEVVLLYADSQRIEHEMALAQREGELYLFSDNFSGDAEDAFTLTAVAYTLDGTRYQITFADLGVDATWYLNYEESGITAYELGDDEAEEVEESVVELDSDADENDIEDAVQEMAEQYAAETTSASARSASSSKGELVVVLDPGHGGSDPGAVSSNGKLTEAVLNLKIAKYTKAELETYKGVKVYLTRTSNTYISLQGRVEKAASYGADVFVSIHLNSGGGRGAEVYYPNANYDKNGVSSEGKKLAQKILNELTGLGLKNRGIKVRSMSDKYPDGSKQDYYGVIRRSKLAGFPGIIVEHAFIDSSSDVSGYLKSESGLKKLGVADATGIAKAYGLKKNTWVAPKLKTPEASASGRKVSWKSVTGASGYAVYRKASGGDWSMIATTTSTSYTDAAALSAGKTYYYTVRAYKGAEETVKASKYSASCWGHYNSAGVKIVYLATPEITGTSTASSGIKVSWEKVSGATGYGVYRKKGDGDWSLVATTTSTSYTDKSSLSAGRSYAYTVRAYKGSKATSNKYNAAYWSGYSATGVPAVSLSTPKLSSVAASAVGTRVSWKSVTGASGYAVYRKASGGDWSMIATTTSTSYTDAGNLSSGSTYYYTVRAFKGSEDTAKANKYSASCWSHYDTSGLKVVYLKTPQLMLAVRCDSEIKISWDKVSGASGYAVYRRESGDDWFMIGTSTPTSYVDKTASEGKTYQYTVRAYRGSLNTAKSNKYSAAYWSGYNDEGISIL